VEDRQDQPPLTSWQRRGAKVLVVDFKRKIGTPVQCAEFVPIQLYHHFKEFFDEEGYSPKGK
jgi:digeranylgeranylglycerophospholipid reductase